MYTTGNLSLRLSLGLSMDFRADFGSRTLGRWTFWSWTFESWTFALGLSAILRRMPGFPKRNLGYVCTRICRRTRVASRRVVLAAVARPLSVTVTLFCSSCSSSSNEAIPLPHNMKKLYSERVTTSFASSRPSKTSIL